MTIKYIENSLIMDNTVLSTSKTDIKKAANGAAFLVSKVSNVYRKNKTLFIFRL